MCSLLGVRSAFCSAWGFHGHFLPKPDCPVLICLQDWSSSKHDLVRQQYWCICGSSGSVGFGKELWVILKILKTFGELAVIFLHIKYLSKKLLTMLKKSWSLLNFDWVNNNNKKCSELSKLLKCWQDENLRKKKWFRAGCTLFVLHFVTFIYESIVATCF